MNSQHFILLASFAWVLAACDQQQEVTASTKTAQPIETNQQASAADAQPEAAEKKSSKIEKPTPVLAKGNGSVNAVKPQTSEDALAEVAAYGREKTRTQISKTRNRAQEAEEEMLRDLAQHK